MSARLLAELSCVLLCRRVQPARCPFISWRRRGRAAPRGDARTPRCPGSSRPWGWLPAPLHACIPADNVLSPFCPDSFLARAHGAASANAGGWGRSSWLRCSPVSVRELACRPVVRLWPPGFVVLVRLVLVSAVLSACALGWSVCLSWTVGSVCPSCTPFPVSLPPRPPVSFIEGRTPCEGRPGQSFFVCTRTHRSSAFVAAMPADSVWSWHVWDLRGTRCGTRSPELSCSLSCQAPAHLRRPVVRAAGRQAQRVTFYHLLGVVVGGERRMQHAATVRVRTRVPTRVYLFGTWLRARGFAKPHAHL